jgi:hypothetical protein
MYDGTQWELLNNAVPGWQLGTAASVASASTTTLPAGQNNVTITGTTTITSFGNSASAASPLYYINFTGNLQITAGASMLTPGGVNIKTAVGDTALVQFLGSSKWQFLQYWNVNSAGSNLPFTGFGAPACVNALFLQPGATPATQIAITANYAYLTNAAMAGVGFSSVSLTLNCATTGANGLDTGSLAAGWYYTYLISNGQAIASLASLSSTVPTLPAGYTYSMRIGSFYYNGTASSIQPYFQYGNKVQFQVKHTPSQFRTLPAASGANNISGSSLSLAAMVPPTAVRIMATMGTSGGGSATIPISTNNDYTDIENGSGAPMVSSPNYVYSEFNFETAQTLYYVMSAGTTQLILNALGYIEQINAN